MLIRRPEVVLPISNTHILIEGIVEAELIHAASGLVVQHIKPFRNLIVDAGLNAIGNGTTLAALTNHLAVGTGNSTPVVGQIALDAEIGRTTNNGGFSDQETVAGDYSYVEIKRTRLFLEAEANGNLTEVGSFSASTGPSMFFRQLFRDELNNPITVTKTNTHQLRIYYTYRLYPMITVAAQTKTIGGVSTDLAERAQTTANCWSGTHGLIRNLGGWPVSVNQSRSWESNAMPVLGSSPSGSFDNCTSFSWEAYTANNFFRDGTAVYDPGDGNFPTGLGAVTSFVGSTSGGQAFITTFTPKVDKTDLKRFTHPFRVSWARRP